MSSPLTGSKAALRRQLKARRRVLGASNRLAWSRAAAAQLMASTPWERAQTIGLFHSLPLEINTQPLIEAALAQHKRVALPKVVSRRSRGVGEASGLALFDPYQHHPPALAKGAFGVIEPTDRAQPVALEALDLVVVPGLAFDDQGRRLGYGGGYFDGLLATLRCPTVMLAFACQQVTRVPTEPHDVPVGGVATERGVLWISCE